MLPRTTNLETQAPRVKVRAGELPNGGLGQMNVETLALVDKRATISGHVNDAALLNFPDRLVQFLDLIGDALDVLHRATFGNHLVAHGWRPHVKFDQILINTEEKDAHKG